MSSDKKNALIKIFSNKIHAISLGIFDLLQENKRMNMLLSIAKQYSIIYDYSKSIQVAKVTTAIPLTTELETKVMAKIVELTNNKASLENIVNPSILGGFILRVGDVQYDASISNHLNELRRAICRSQGARRRSQFFGGAEPPSAWGARAVRRPCCALHGWPIRLFYV